MNVYENVDDTIFNTDSNSITELENLEKEENKQEFSDYFKCDLHIHTDYSNKTKTNDYKGNFSIDELLKKISSPEHDVKMFSLTDHNIINVPAYEEYYNSYDIPERCLLVGIELDIILEKYLLKKIYSNINSTPYDKEKYHSLIIFKSKDANDLNNKLNQMYKKISDDYNKEYTTNIDLNSGQIKNRFTSLERFANEFISEDYIVISHGNKEAGIKDAYKSYDVGMTEAQIMVLIGIINAVEMSPGNNSKIIYHFNRGFQSLLKDDFSAKKEVPYMAFSDNHNLLHYPKHDKDQKLSNQYFTWIKGTLTFETLRMSFVDPTSRIVVDLKKPKYPEKFIEKISFSTIKGTEEVLHSIPLSPGINTIVGGRSSGKSLLFNSILHSLSEGKAISKIGDYTKVDNMIINKSNIKSKLNFSDEFSNNNVCEINAFTQEGIINLFDNNGVGLKDKLEFEKLDATEINSKISSYNLIIDNFVDSYSDLLNKRADYNSNIPITIFKASSKILKEKYIVRGIIDDLKNNSEFSLIEISNLMNKIKSSLINVKEIKSIKLKDVEIFSYDEVKIIDKYIELLENKYKYIYALYKRQYIKEVYISNLEKNLMPIAEKHMNSESAKISQAKDSIKNDLKKIYDYFRSKLKYKKCASCLEQKIILIDEKNKKISDNYTLNTRVDKKIDINYIKEIFEEKVLNYDINLSISKNFENMINGKIKVSRKNNSSESVKWLFDYVKSQINTVLTPKYTIIEKEKDLSLSSDNMSQGKKASIYLEILLEKCKNSNSIILIDQPEDNIDNVFITDVLIDKIRELRMKNQIILVTHNAAIAINSDSENIIIAENNDGIFNYEIGGLENELHRKKVCKLLDGGNYIFDNRYHKYNIINNKVSEPIRKGEVDE